MASRSRSATEVSTEVTKVRPPAKKSPRQPKPAPPAQEAKPAHTGNATGPKELRLNGSIRVVLTWNLRETAFLKSDGSRDRYPLVRGSGEFAKFVRSLGERLAKSADFEVDDEKELSNAYSSGLISQYAAEYELNATFRIKDRISVKELAPKPQAEGSLKTAQGKEVAPIDPFTAAWEAWPIKRFRISRYGFLQVILETQSHDQNAAAPERFVSPTDFLAPIKLLHEPIEVPDRPSGDNWIGRPDLALTAQWEIMGCLLAKIIDVIIQAVTPEDLLRFDPAYRSEWRNRKTFAAGTSLPLRTEYATLWIREITLAGVPVEPAKLTREDRERIASLLEELPWIEPQGVPQQISPQRRKAIRRALAQDEATWKGEMCLLSFGTAVLTTLHPLKMCLPRKTDYESYWRVVQRVIEYFAELRLLGWIVERQSADLFEYMLRDIANTHRLGTVEDFVGRNAGLSGLANRLRVAASVDTIAQNDGIFPKAQRLHAIFEIGRSLEHANRNLSAIQNLITSDESQKNEKAILLQNELTSTESQKNEKAILLWTSGLAGFTAILMGLAIPPFFHYSHEMKTDNYVQLWSFLRPISLVSVVFAWGHLSVLMTALALGTATRYVLKLFRVRHRIKGFAKIFGG